MDAYQVTIIVYRGLYSFVRLIRFDQDSVGFQWNDDKGSNAWNSFGLSSDKFREHLCQ